MSPRPPPAFGLVILLHAIQHIFLVLFRESSHQKRVKTDCIRLHRLAGISKQDIGYVGMESMTDLSIVSFPALDSRLIDQLEALCLIRSTMEVNISRFFLPKYSGSPRYLPVPPSLSMPSRVFYAVFLSSGVLLENVIDDFSELIFCPEAFS